jgi:hypothetical protein
VPRLDVDPALFIEPLVKLRQLKAERAKQR